jgi:1-acyl-sn-glycerol-3-phosphate acyltransferase
VAREAIVCGLFDSLVHTYARVEVTGREHLAEVDGPAIIVANHCSHVDTPVLLRALPRAWRRRTAVTAAADYFYSSRVLGATVSLAFGTVPLQRRNSGAAGGAGSAHRSTDSLKPLIDAGWNLVVFPEGTRSRDGRVGSLRTGAAGLAAEHGLPIVPVHIDGTHDAMPVGRSWMNRPDGGGRFARHTLRISFGHPLHVGQGDDLHEAMENVRLFMQVCGAQTTPDPKLGARRAAAATAEAESEAKAKTAAEADARRVPQGRSA